MNSDPQQPAVDRTLAGLGADPIRQFTAWLAEARERSGLPNPNAMTLATATPGGAPSARIVLLKGHGADGFVFFTNYCSAKGRELEANPRAELVFHWDPLERQVRVRGPVKKVSAEQTEAYFHTRPRISQLGAWASRQSEALSDPDQVDRAYAEKSAEYGDGPIPVPPNWGGFAVIPERIEFWIGRPGRMHQRVVFTRSAGGAWNHEMLSP